MQLEGRLHVLWYVRGCQQLDVSLYTCTSRDETDVEVFACDLAAKLEETPAQVEPVVKVEKEKSTESYSATTLGKGNSNGFVRLDLKAISWDGNASPDDDEACEIANNIVCR
ncbi:hypothetical protein RHGRI_029070 [Rhododendron griersonianum]|uniref:Uncharacterized protein n=1 Tax=Rhododendron griersonianum TaxID=479676 RepID=A0AAV6IMN7_9ERIC|nr:hypothetical protein RHGRI_029070 [Rhododendron griersonianum]